MPYIDDFKDLKLFDWLILLNALSGLLIIIEVADIPCVSFHEDLIPHLKDRDRPAQEESLNSYSVVLKVKLRAKVLIGERLEYFIFHVPVHDGTLEHSIKKHFGFYGIEQLFLALISLDVRVDLHSVASIRKAA